MPINVLPSCSSHLLHCALAVSCWVFETIVVFCASVSLVDGFSLCSYTHSSKHSTSALPIPIRMYKMLWMKLSIRIASINGISVQHLIFRGMQADIQLSTFWLIGHRFFQLTNAHLYHDRYGPLSRRDLAPNTHRCLPLFSLQRIVETKGQASDSKNASWEA